MGMMKNIFKIMNEMMNMKKMEKMNMNKNEKKMEKMNKGIENLKNLKSLKSLMQIFAESANSANSAKQIFATFATFAMSIFSGIANIANIAMQIFKRPAAEALRTVPVKSTVKVALKSRITSSLPAFATNPILSRICLVSLILLVVGGFYGEVWGVDTVTGLGDTTPENQGGVWYSLYDCTSGDGYKDSDTRIFDVVSPTNGTISYQWRKGHNRNGYELYASYIQKGSNSYTSEATWVKSSIYSDGDGFHSETKSLGVETSKVKVRYGSGTGDRYYRNLTVQLAKHIYLDNGDAYGATTKTITIDPVVYGSTSAATRIHLRSFLMDGTTIRYKIVDDTNSEFSFASSGSRVATQDFSVLANSCAFNGGSADCALTATELGNPDNQEVDVYFTPASNTTSSAYTEAKIKIYDVSAGGVETERATVTVQAKIIPNYYFKATAVASAGDAAVKASFVENSFSAASVTKNVSGGSVGAASPSVTAYYSAPASNGDYQFQGWFKDEECTQRLTTALTYDSTFTSTLDGATPKEVVLYAQYLQEIRAEFGGSDQTMKVEDSYAGIYYIIAPSALVASASSDDDFWYEIIVDSISEVTTGSVDGDAVISYNPGTKVVTAINAGKARLILHQEATGLYVDVDKTYTFTVNKHDPDFTWYSDANTVHFNETIENFCTSNQSATSIDTRSSVESVATISDATLTTYNKTGTTRITMTQAENYYWNEYSEYRDITPVKANNHVPFTYSQALYDLNTFTIAKNQNYWWTDDEPYHLALNENQDSYVILHFDGIPDKMTFYYKTKGGSISKMYVQESAANDFTEESAKPWSTTTNYTSNWSDLQTIQLQPTTRYVKIFYRGSKLGRIKDIAITEKSMQFAVDQTSLDFEIVQKDSEPAAKKFTFTHCNAGYRVTATSSDATHYKVSLNAAGPWSESVVIPSTGGDRMGTQDIYVKYYPADAATHNATITLIDQLGNSKTVNVTGVTQAELATTLEWIGATATYNVDNDNVPVTDLFRVTYNAGRNVVASPTINLATSDDTKIRIVTVDDVDYIDFLCGGGDDVTITASYAGDGETYAAASDLEQEITVNKLADAIVWDGVDGEDGTIHIQVRSSLPVNTATSNTRVRYSSDDDYIEVTNGATIGETTLVTKKHGTVTLTATSDGDCTYLSAEDSKTITIDPLDHDIVWDQSFVGLLATEEGVIDTTITLSASAVNEYGVPTGVRVSYSLSSTSFASLDGNQLHVTGTGSAVLTVTTVDDNLYAVTTKSKTIRSRRLGEGCGSEVSDADQHSVGWYQNNGGKIYDNLPPSDKIYVKVGKYSTATQTLYIYGYDANDTEKVLDSYGAGSLTTSGEDKEIDITEDIRKIKIQAGGTVSKWYSNLRITQKSYLRTDKSSISKDDIIVGGSVNENVTISYSDKPILQYRYTGRYLTLTPNEPVNNDCGDYGSYTFTLAGTMPIPGTYDEHIYITTSARDEIDIPVHLVVSTSSAVVIEEKVNPEWTEDDRSDMTTPVEVQKNITITEQVEAYSVTVAKNTTVTISPTGGLTVGAGGINIESDAESTGKLVLQVKENDGSKGIEDEIGQTSYILFSPDYDGEMPEATVQMLSTGYRDMRSGTFDSWQYVGVSIDRDDYAAKDVFTQNAVRSWNESTNKWVNNRKTLMLEPFVGYATQQYNTADGIIVNFDGQLARNRGTHTIYLTHYNEGWNLLANSFAAPIDITKFDIGDFGGAEATIYVWDTKNRRYIEVPVGTAKETPGEVASLIIASMQGFFVKTNTATTLTLDYNKLVWGGEQANKPLKVRKNSQDSSLSAKMHIRLTDDNAGMDELTILESANHDKSYENGYDSKKKHSENNGISIYAIENDVQLGFDYTDVIEGTKIGVRTGDSDFYMITFNNVETDGSLYLYDMHTNIYTLIKEGATYSFYAEPNSYVEGRFEIVERHESGISTDAEEVEEETKTVKYIKDNTIYILKDGVKYNGMGQRVQ